MSGMRRRIDSTRVIWIFLLSLTATFLATTSLASPPSSAAEPAAASAPAPVTPEDLIRQHLDRAQSMLARAAAPRQEERTQAQQRRTAKEISGLLRALEKSWHSNELTNHRLRDDIRRSHSHVALLAEGRLDELRSRLRTAPVLGNKATNALEEIRGQVTAENDGQPIFEAFVRIVDEGVFSDDTFSDDNGQYSFDLPGPGTYYLQVSSSLYQDEIFENLPCDFFFCDLFAGTPIVVASDDSRQIDFSLSRLGRISGTLTDDATGLPLSGRVEAWDENFNILDTGFTDSDGHYELEGLATGSVFVVAEVSGYLAELYDDVPCPGGAFFGCEPQIGSPIAVQLETTVTGIDFALNRLGSISGRVTDAETGVGLPFAQVEFTSLSDSSSGFTDDAGNYSFSGLEPSTYFVYTRSTEGYVDGLYDGFSCFNLGDLQGCDPTTGTPIEVEVESEVTGIDIALQLGGSISGTIRRQDNLEPIQFMELEVLTADGIRVSGASTDATGRYTASSLDTGNFLVLTTHYPMLYVNEVYDDIACDPLTGCQPLDGTPVAVTRGQTTSDINFSLQSLAGIRGQVRDASDGQPLAFVSIEVVGQTGGLAGFGETDIDGRYEILGLGAGTYFVLTRQAQPYVDEIYDDIKCPSPGCDARTGEPLNVVIGQTLEDIDFDLDQGGRISGSITSAATGFGVSGFMTVYDTGGHQVQSNFVFDNYTIDGLATGSYYLLFSGDNHIQQVFGGGNCFADCDPFTGTLVQVNLSETTSGIDFLLDRWGRITGSVTDDFTGQPTNGAFIDIWNEDGDLMGSDFIGGAEYTVGSLRPGTYYATASGFDWSNQLFSGLPCSGPIPGPDCDPAAGTPIQVALNTTNTDIDFELTLLRGLQGRVTAADSGFGVAGVAIDLWDSFGNRVEATTTSANGTYSFVRNAGTYYVSTDNGLGGVDELYDDIACPGGAAAGFCDPLTGTPVTVTTGQVTANIDFALEGIQAFSCQVTDTTLCLQNGRFEVSATWRDFEQRTGAGQAVGLTNDSGYFWFFANTNVEMVVKVLDACNPFDSFWVFAAGLTNVEVQMTVRDTLTGAVRTYDNPLATPFAPVLDTAAFATCSGSVGDTLGLEPTIGESSSLETPARSTLHMAASDSSTAALDSAREKAQTNTQKMAICGVDALCLNSGRFSVVATWRTPTGSQDIGQPVLLTDDTGYFWFFSDDNVEVVIKVLDACVDPFDRFWVFAAGLTNVEVQLRVVDTLTGEFRDYLNPLNQPFQPLLDTDAFATCQ